MRKYKIALLTATALCCIGLTGCRVTGLEEMTAQEENTVITESVNKVSQTSTALVDNKSLYELQDDTGVVTMYLTVSQGNTVENTNHTWSELNSRSVYYYDELGIARDATEALLQVGDENGPVAGELGYGKSVPNAIVTTRGQTSSRNTQKNYKIELKDGKGTWNDQKTILLNKHQGEGLRFRNKLTYDLMQDVPDLISLRTQFVHLYVCDQTEGDNSEFVDYGLYTQVEQANKRMLESHGLDKNGHLYKINFFEFFRYEDIIKETSEEGYDQEAFEELLEIKGSDDHSKLIAMLEDVNDESIPIEEVVDKWFDQDNILTWLSFQILTGNTDTQSRNTLIYSPLNVDRWYFINWDCDSSFRYTEREILGEDVESGWETGITNYWGNELFQRILKSESMREKLHEKMDELRLILSEDAVREKVEAYKQVVQSYNFSYPDVERLPLTEEQFEEVCEAVPKEVEENYQRYLKTLEQPMPFFIGAPLNTEEGLEFTWDIAFDFDAEDILYSLELSDELDFSNMIYQEEEIFVPGAVYQGTLEPGQYFVRVKAVNESGYEQTAFDYYVPGDVDKFYGIKCFYVLADGSIQEDVYEE